MLQTVLIHQQNNISMILKQRLAFNTTQYSIILSNEDHCALPEYWHRHDIDNFKTAEQFRLPNLGFCHFLEDSSKILYD